MVYTFKISRYLFPVPKEDSKRVITFANHDDFISYRHHTYKKGEAGKGIELKEVGPRFQLRCKSLFQLLSLNFKLTVSFAFSI
jgi:U3 small nucleolar ribonucleoprotein protein IMP4